MGNTAGGLLAHSHSLVKGEGLMIATWARPPRLMRGAAGVSLSPAPGHRKQSVVTAFGLDGIAQRQILHNASWGRHRWLCRTWRVLAHLPVLLTGAGTYLPCWVCNCQGMRCDQAPRRVKASMISCMVSASCSERPCDNRSRS